MCNDEKFRYTIKQDSGLPTIPVTTDHRDNTWLTTDIYEAELYQDTDTGVMYTRFGSEIVTINGKSDPLTSAELTTLANNEDLIPGKSYFITDKNLLVTAVTVSVLASCAVRWMRIVKDTYYTPAGINLGVWNSSLTPSSGDIVVWGGKVWENVAGAVGTAPDEDTLSAAWTLIPTTDDTYYRTKSFCVIYDRIANKVVEQRDDQGNIIRSNRPPP